MLKYRISFNKPPGTCLILKLYSAVLIGERCLKEGNTYLKVRGIIQMNFQNFVIFSFQPAINKYQYPIQSYIVLSS